MSNWSLKPRPNVFAHFLGTFLVASISTGCKARTFADLKTVQNENIPLAPNDISFLYPPLSGLDLPVAMNPVASPVPQGLQLFEPKPVKRNDPIFSRVYLRQWEEVGGSIAAFEATQSNPTGWTTGPDFPFLFDSTVYAQIRAAISQDPDQTKIKFPFFFDWLVKLPNTPFEKTDVLAPWRWRVVSWRYDPCPTVLHTAFTDSSRRGACNPQIRVVAQPLIGLNDMESFSGEGLPDMGSKISKADLSNHVGPHSGLVYADYAMHFFLKVTNPERLEKQFQGLKQDHRSVCPTVPYTLSIHPCLWYQFQSLASDGPKIDFARGLRRVLVENKGPLLHVAVMTSKRNNTPWKFMLLNPDSSTGELKAAVQIALDPSSYPKGSGPSASGKELAFFRSIGHENFAPLEEEFDSKDEYAAAIAKYLDSRKRIKAGMNERSRLSARVKPGFDSLDIFLRTEAKFQDKKTYLEIVEKAGASPSATLAGLKNIKITKTRSLDLFALADRIENPGLNNEFTSDCASCHTTLTEKQQVILDLTLKSQIEPDEKKELETVVGADTAKIEQAPFVATNEGYRYSSRSSADDMYVTNQFSYYRASPIISRRVANETARALSLLINQELRPKPRKSACNPRRFDFCMTSWASFTQKWSPKYLTDFSPTPNAAFKRCLDESECG